MKILSIVLLAYLADANVYLHSPRGSNNRLNEKSAQNKNKKRLFDSNNNRRGGYNVGDKTDEAFANEAGQYAMQYFQSGIQGQSYLTVEWTSLLGCGVDEDGDKIHDCEIVIQTNCQSDDVDGVPPADSYTLRNGRVTSQMPYQVDPTFAVASKFEEDENEAYLRIQNDDISSKFQEDAINDEEYMRLYNNDDANTVTDVEYAFYQDLDDDNDNEQQDDAYEDGTYDDDESMSSLSSQDSTSEDENGDEDEDEDDNASMDDNDNESVTQEDSTKDEDCGGSLRNIINKLVSPETPVPESELEQQQGHRRAQTNSQTRSQKNARRAVSVNRDIGLHESWEYYDRCDPNAQNRHGMECSSERQQWPDSSISPWVDVAYFTDDAKNKCTSDIELLNQRQFFECVEYYDGANQLRRHKSIHQSEEECTLNGGDWLGFYKVGDILDDIASEDECLGLNGGKKDYVWGRPMSWKDVAEDKLSAETCIVMPARTECLEAPNTRSGYLGNVDNSRNTPRFQWALPNHVEDKKCVFRIRYIISVPDDDIVRGDNIHYLDNNNDGLSLAPTANRVVFEDRSHIFKLLQRPAEIPDDLMIHNLVVRGKRGNIVQTFPAVEYDFVPNRLTIPQGEAIHVQWTGSNRHNNQSPGGDGQTGDAGEGRGGTDRNNFIQLIDRKTNLVAPDHMHTLFDNAQWVWSSHDMGDSDNHGFNLALSMATSGYYQCETNDECARSFDNTLQDQLNNAPASYHGNIFVPSQGEYHYKCMRNDNFSNRSQKGTITVL